MDDQRTVIIVAVVILSLFCLFTLSRCGRTPDIDQPSTSLPSEYKPPVQPTRPPPRPAPISAISSGGGGTSALEREIAEAEKQDQEHNKKVFEENQAWLERYVNDENVSTFTRETYKIRNNPNIQSANYHYKKGNIEKAEEFFRTAFEDPNSPPSVRYTAARFLQGIARGRKDPDGYFQWGKELGKLIAENDFSCFDEPKSDVKLERIKEKELLFKARNDPSLLESMAKSIVDRTDNPAYTVQHAKDELQRKIKRVEREVLG